jgi:hypothetical protein
MLAVLVLAVVSGILFFISRSGMLPVNEAAVDWYDLKARQEARLVRLPNDDAPHEAEHETW